MTESDKHSQATQVYQTLCNYLDQIGCPYFKKEDDLHVHAIITGEDLFIVIDFYVDEVSQLLHLESTFPFIIPEDRRIEGALASCIASAHLSDGNFNYDINNGIVSFRMHESFIDRPLSLETFHYMIFFASNAADSINDKFFLLSRGLIGVEDIRQQLSENSDS